LDKTLLIISAGIEALTGIELAQSAGLHVVASDGDHKAPGLSFADDHFIADTYDIQSTLEASIKYNNEVRPIDGVISIASDIPLTVMKVADALGLPGISLEAATLASDKLAMKARFSEDKIPIPWFCQVESADHLKKLISSEDFPLILKPADSRGSRGVLQLSESLDLDWAFNEAQRYSPSKRVMVERFLEGPQVSTESLMIDGIAHTPGFADRNYEFMARYAPNVIENGGQLPSGLDAKIQTDVKKLVQAAAISMGVRNGVIKGDIVVHRGKPYVIELAARLSGGYFCTHEIPLNTGVDLVGAAIRQALGQPVNPDELNPKFQKPVAQRYFFPDPGEVTKIDGLENFEDHPDIALLEIRVKKGDLVKPINSHPSRAGVVITTGETQESAIALAERVIREVEITVS
jgi:biotin carboxylase